MVRPHIFVIFYQSVSLVQNIILLWKLYNSIEAKHSYIFQLQSAIALENIVQQIAVFVSELVQSLQNLANQSLSTWK